MLWRGGQFFTMNFKAVPDLVNLVENFHLPNIVHPTGVHIASPASSKHLANPEVKLILHNLFINLLRKYQESSFNQVLVVRIFTGAKY